MSREGRIFASVNLAPSLGQAASRLQQELFANLRGVVPVKPRDMHFTLRYFGLIDDDTLARVSGACGVAAAMVSAFSISISGIGFFPDPRRPRVLWTGIGEGRASFQALYERLEDCLEGAGLEREKRPFMPHLTLARLDRGAMVFASGPHTPSDACLGSQIVDRISLMESRPGRSDPRYICLASWPLAWETCL